MRNFFIRLLNCMVFSFILLLAYSCDKEVFVEPKSLITDNLYSSLFINSNPAGARIYLNGRNTGLFTPDTVKYLTPGTASVTLKKNLFWDTTFSIQTVSGIKSNCYIDYYLSTRMLGAIVCRSTPSGASIYLDNVNTGKVTPYVLSKLIPKVYSVKFEYPEYRKDSLSISVESMSTNTAEVVLDDTLDVIKFNTGNSALPSNYITGIAEDKKGNIWIGTGSEGIALYDGKTFTKFNSGNSSFMKSNYVRRIKSDKENNIWVGFSNALSRYDGNNWISYPSGSIYSIQVNYDNSVLAANDRYGIIKYAGGTFSVINKDNSGLPENDITSAVYDKTGKLWAAFRNGKIGIYDGVTWTLQDSLHNGLPYNFCSGLNLTGDGRIVAIFYDRPNGPSPTAYHSVAYNQNGYWVKLSSKFVANIEDKELFIDKSEKTWIAYNGPNQIVCRINNGNYNWEYFYNSIIYHNIRKLVNVQWTDVMNYFLGGQVFIDSKDNLWIYGGEGVIKIKAGRWFK